jgi:hypothetical protein
MASINASTSGAGGVITTADNTGTLQLQSGGTTIATISSTGLALNTGNITLPSTAAPTFYTTRITTNQSISANTWTKVQCQSEDWDTNSNYDNATNFRFTPTVAGYYQFSGGIEMNNVSGFYQIAFYKNGSSHRLSSYYANSTNGSQFSISDLIYCNGTTDYVELWGATSTSSNAFYTGGITRFGGVFVRSA